MAARGNEYLFDKFFNSQIADTATFLMFGLMKKIGAFIPNLITLLNLSAGVVAIFCAIYGDMGRAAIFIGFAAVFDFLDGFFARLLKAYSAIGKELDSLADVVSFGVAPSAVMFTLMQRTLFGEIIPIYQIDAPAWQWAFMLGALLIPAFSAYRLAKFNLDTQQSENFLGMPTPANAILWASFGLMTAYANNEPLMLVLFKPGNLLVAAVVTSLLLVSEIPMFSLKFRNFDFFGNWYRYVFLLAALLLIIFTGIYAISIIMLLYITLSISFYLLKAKL